MVSELLMASGYVLGCLASFLCGVVVGRMPPPPRPPAVHLVLHVANGMRSYHLRSAWSHSKVGLSLRQQKIVRTRADHRASARYLARYVKFAGPTGVVDPRDELEGGLLDDGRSGFGSRA